MFDRWNLTVCSVTHSRSAMPAFVRPSAARRRISSSRGVSGQPLRRPSARRGVDAAALGDGLVGQLAHERAERDRVAVLADQRRRRRRRTPRAARRATCRSVRTRTLAAGAAIAAWWIRRPRARSGSCMSSTSTTSDAHRRPGAGLRRPSTKPITRKPLVWRRAEADALGHERMLGDDQQPPHMPHSPIVHVSPAWARAGSPGRLITSSARL